ncbi:MAG: hypothetical protein ABH807_00560 [Candidatus Shapirobacteria bacterium]
MPGIKKIIPGKKKGQYSGSRRGVLLVFALTLLLAFCLYLVPMLLAFWQRFTAPAFV